MYRVVREGLIAFHKHAVKFWYAVLRFGSPRLSVDSVTELFTEAANDDECSCGGIDSQGQLTAA